LGRYYFRTLNLHVTTSNVTERAELYKTVMKRNNILITVDLEGWFQVENFKNSIPFSEWGTKEFRFENNTRKLLEIFEEYNIKATFFILGRNPKY
jgi:peptidoglycan/xylan/chitin deacetylase (PgdA/CDA1 family)